MFERIAVSLVFCMFGLALIMAYVIDVRRRFGVRIDPVQAVLYRVDTSKFAVKDRAVEFILRMLKHLGVFVAVVSVIAIFVG